MATTVQNQQTKWLSGDRVIWSVVILLSLVSMLVVYSSVSELFHKKKGLAPEFHLMKHLITQGLGLVIMWMVHRIPYKRFSKYAAVAFLLVIPLLLVTLIGGSSVNNAKRWLSVPIINLSFQTSDFAKLALLAYLARELSQREGKFGTFKEVFFPIFLPVLVVCGLILPGNLSTCAALFAVAMVVMFIARVPIKHLLSFSGIVVGGFVLLIGLSTLAPNLLPRAATWKNRLMGFSVAEQDVDKNYQPRLARIAIATGGAFGKGPGKSIQRGVLPQASSDFIYAIVIEEYGTLLGGTLLLLYLILLFRGLRIVSRCPSIFGKLLGFGIAFSLVFQGMLNMGVAVHLLPVTGQTLPFISMGGTSIWSSSLAIGIMLSISRELDEPAEATQEKEVQHA
jgi:cell division protein FtsW